jgi:hypothetical protein
MTRAARKPAEDNLEPENDPIFAALDRAPIGEPWTPEQQTELDQDMEDIRTGRAVLIRHEDRDAWYEAHKQELGERPEE